MRRISTSFISIALVLLATVANASQKQVGAVPPFTLNAVEVQASGETTDMALTQGGPVLHVNKHALLSNEDFRHAWVTSRKGHIVLRVSLSDSGAIRLKDFSLTHVGQKLAILVDSKVVAAPEIRVPIKKGFFETDALSEAQATQLAHFINSNSRN